jgi:hypothetical protein
MAKIELTGEEKKLIESQRLLTEKIKACSDEVNEVLKKHGMTLQLVGSPQIAVVPVRQNG